ncbi:SAM-dependent methyltransferase [Rhodococcus oryzae]|uniref:S-adenosyl-L-methionine-dependent methyltransferase n=1 Tax=Rhodococcus oryzae TaxID=2571143 RepID=A0ABY2RL14_9NOCA|nr:class I SAM-dependent methyltransferase [Rhodococcus oryzae]TJZ78376.1 SAM-dependent methyltransferase [Rhodococcus oryzae]
MRTDGDTWDIVSSVGRTALGVATFRALESERPDPLITDGFARWFVEAAGDQHFTRLLADPSPLEKMPFFFPGFMGVRTRFFDEYFTAASADGVAQAVIVAAGLDARAYRLDWAPDVAVFEVDQPKVLAFKSRVLDAHGARPKVDRRPVAVDLREDWPAALEAGGFDPGRPCAWSAEGLLPYLPGAAHDALFERIDGLSAAGSRIALDGFGAGTDVKRFLALRDKYFGDKQLDDIDIASLFYDDERADPAQWLTDHGWTVRRFSPVELTAAYGVEVPDLPDDLADLARTPAYLTATK